MNNLLTRLEALQRIHDLETLPQIKQAGVYDSNLRRESAKLCLGIQQELRRIGKRGQDNSSWVTVQSPYNVSKE